MKEFISVLLFATLLFSNISDVVASSPQKRKTKKEDVIVMPEFPGGQEELNKYLMRETRYPYEAQVNDFKGEVLVEFMVERSGMISGAKVIKSVAKPLDIEAIRVISNMPNWRPGTKNGMVMRTQLTIPINFKLLREVNKFVDGEAMDNGIEKKNDRSKKAKF